MEGILNISINGAIGNDAGFSEAYSFEKFQKALAQKPDAAQVNIHIASNGGDVFTGYDIGNLIKAEKAKGKKFVAIIGSRAASVATYIAACCDEIDAYANSKWLIHMPRNEGAGGTAAQIEQTAKVLRSMEADFIDQYAAKSGQDKAAIIALMNKDTFITAQEAKDLGYITRIIENVTADIDTAFEAVATYNNFKPQYDIMADTKNVAKQIFAELGKLFKADATAMVEIDGGTPKEGARVTMDGAPAPDGVHKLPDGTEITVAGGVITAIKEAPAADSEEVIALKAQIAELQAANATALADKETVTAKVTELEGKLTASTTKETEATTLVASLKTQFTALDAALKKELPNGTYRAVTGLDVGSNNSRAGGDKNSENGFNGASDLLALMKRK